MRRKASEFTAHAAEFWFPLEHCGPASLFQTDVLDNPCLCCGAQGTAFLRGERTNRAIALTAGAVNFIMRGIAGGAIVHFAVFFALSFVRAGIQNEKKRFFRVFLTFSGKARIILLILGKDGAAPKSDERSKQNGKAFAVCGAPHALAARVPSVIQKPWGAFPVLWKGFLFYNYLTAPCHKEICHAAIDKAFGGGGRKPAGRLRPFARTCAVCCACAACARRRRQLLFSLRRFRIWEIRSRFAAWNRRYR